MNDELRSVIALFFLRKFRTVFLPRDILDRAILGIYFRVV